MQGLFYDTMGYGEYQDMNRWYVNLFDKSGEVILETY